MTGEVSDLDALKAGLRATWTAGDGTTAVTGNIVEVVALRE